MNWIAAIIGLFIGCCLQAQMSDRIAPAIARPSFLLGVSLCVSFFPGSRVVASTSLLSGMLESALCGLYMGPFIISRVISALLVSYLIEPFQLNILIVWVVSTISAAAAQVVFYLLQPVIGFVEMIQILIWQSVVTGIIVTALFPLATRFAHRVNLDVV